MHRIVICWLHLNKTGKKKLKRAWLFLSIICYTVMSLYYFKMYKWETQNRCHFYLLQDSASSSIKWCKWMKWLLLFTAQTFINLFLTQIFHKSWKWRNYWQLIFKAHSVLLEIFTVQLWVPTACQVLCPPGF